MNGGVVRLGRAVAVWGLVLIGCTSGGGEPPGSTAKAGATRTTDPSPTAVVDIDPAELPTTRDQAAALIRNVIADPSDFGPGTVRRTVRERRAALVGPRR
ncbi:hypothetical protein [Streptomyces sp. Inha503]|uniref:hypothetical protein n=1 Tax=Streptomyces sp. Inha503 TaxID=3383314 RepID=UPI0039A21BD3